MIGFLFQMKVRWDPYQFIYVDSWPQKDQMKISHNHNFPTMKHRHGFFHQVWQTGWSWVMCSSLVVQTSICQGYMTWLTGRGRREDYWNTVLWIIWKEQREVNPASLAYLASSSIPTKKWWDALWTTHVWAAFDVPFYLPQSSVSCNACQALHKILQCSLQDQWSWPISCGLLHRTASDSTRSCSPGHNALVVGKRSES